MRRSFLLIVLPVLFFGNACTTDELPRPVTNSCDGIQTSYELNIRQIIDGSCAYSGCHPEYSNYEGLLPVLEDGSFRSRVVTLQADGNLGMPPDYSPDDRPKELSEEQLNLIRCWLSNSYPEN